MIRTIISLDPDDKSWLDRLAAQRGVPMTEVVREAIRRFRATAELPHLSYEAALEHTQGLWQRGDGLEWQERLRDEW
jgi:hypothetical protein